MNDTIASLAMKKARMVRLSLDLERRAADCERAATAARLQAAFHLEIAASADKRARELRQQKIGVDAESVEVAHG